MRWWLLFSLAAVYGCRDVSPDRDLSVVSDAPEYVLGSDATFTLTNRSNRTLFFGACSEGAPPHPTGKIDRFLETGWAEIDGFGGYCPGVGVPVQVPFGPGESMQVGIHLGHSSHVGTLRVRITNDDRVLGISNSFTITN